MNQYFREIETRLAEKRVSIVSKREYLGGSGHRPRIDVLRALEVEPGGLSLAKIVQRVELPRSTVHLIVTALEAESSVVWSWPRLGAATVWGQISRGLRPPRAENSGSHCAPLPSGSGMKPTRRSI